MTINLLTGCGEKTEYTAELGVNGNYYKSQIISQAPAGILDLKIMGDYLYYTQNADGTIKRVSIVSLLTEHKMPDFSRAENVLRLPSYSQNLPEEVKELMTTEGELVLPEKTESSSNLYYTLSPDYYSIDREQNLYYYARLYIGELSDMKGWGGILCKQNEEGEVLYRRYQPDAAGLAADGEGRLYVLTDGKIEILDSEGKLSASISTEEYQEWGKGFPGELFEDTEGRVYYCASNGSRTRKGFEIIEDKIFQLKETDLFSGNNYQKHYAGFRGNRILCDSSGILYEYNRETDSVEKLLRLSDSGMNPVDVRSLVQISEDDILVSYGFISDPRLYLLSKSAANDVEYIVIAPSSGSFILREAVEAFNTSNHGFKVVLDNYGAEYFDESGWDFTILDASLVSGNPPDIVILEKLNIQKYANKGILEDLYPYLEKSSAFSSEDFLDNMLEGLTIDGRLVCIPLELDVLTVSLRSSLAEDLESWTMDDVYLLTEGNPADGPALFDNGSLMGWEREYFFKTFCSSYYLEKFVDWENNECNFDNVEFQKLLAWIGAHKWEFDKSLYTGDIYLFSEYLPEEVQMVSSSSLTFFTQLVQETQCGEKMKLMGMPTVDGKGRFLLEMRGAMAIPSNSSHKEEAWEFLEFCLSYTEKMMDKIQITPIKAELQKKYEAETTPRYSTWKKDEEGNPEIEINSNIYVGHESIPYYTISLEQANRVMEIIENIDFTPITEEEEAIIRILSEEAGSYYSGDKSLEEVTAIIQNRVQLLLHERAK